MRQVFPTMGTVVSLSTEHAGAPVEAIERIFADADRRFSLYRSDSALSRIAAGVLAIETADPAVLALYAEALEWRSRTGAAFTPHRPDGVIDLNGIVKAAAMRDAAAMLDRSGCGAWTLVVGGDVVASLPRVDASQPARIGVIDPADRTRLVCSVALTGRRRAVTTSGSAERGDHIWRNGPNAPEFVQVTVLSDDIVIADVLATAIVAGGSLTLDEACDRWPIDVLTIDRAGLLRATPGLSAAIAGAAPGSAPSISAA